MAKYKEKYNQYLINASKGPSYYYHGDTVVLNLCSCFIKRNNYVKFISTMKEALQFGDSLNLCNLASLCHKWEIPYGGDECTSIITNIKNIISEQYPNIKLVQDNIYNYGEVDMKPLDSLIRVDVQTNGIYINNVLMECLKYLGYVNSQIFNVLQVTRDFNKILPQDMISLLPLANEQSLEKYEKLKEILTS